ncbi:ATP-dependent RNA helicase DDX31/DBP7, partial [Phenoliferia sp. Uapishka_3]
MDDFEINFGTSDPVNNAKRLGTKAKGGRWTDRAKDKRRADGAFKKQQRPPTQSTSTPSQSATTQSATSVPAPQSTAQSPISYDAAAPAKRPRESDANGDNPIAKKPGVMIQPRKQRPPQDIAARSAATLEGQLQPARQEDNFSKSSIGPGGKKQYISSLFTVEGLPAPSKPLAPVVYTRPSNAPMRAAEVDEEETTAAQDEDTNNTVEAAPKPSPAPALAALGLLPQIVNHLAGKLSITGPTACQAMAIPPLISGSSPPSSSSKSILRAHDAILQSQTGSGKTLAFLLPILQDLLTLPRSLFGAEGPSRSVGTMALILAPTRELASQIYDVLNALLSLPTSTGATTAFTVPPFTLTPCLLVGGANRTHEKMRLRKGCPIIVATPGRLLDHLRTTESFRMAGEPAPTKGPRGRGSVPGTGSNYGALGRDRSGAGRALGLRWLVVDECDRLMDLGFEEQMKGVLEELERRSPSASLKGEEGRRRTVLCSATASEGVDRLAGMALWNPVTLNVATVAGGAIVEPKLRPTTKTIAPATSDDADENEEEDDDDAEIEEITRDEPEPTLTEHKIITFTPPTQLVHNYLICPPKLRFVALLALMRRVITSPPKNGPGRKILVFLSCTAAVDFYWEALGALSMSSAAPPPATNVLESAKDKAARERAEEEAARKKLASQSALLPGVPIYRLHGNMELAGRLGSLKAFSGKSIAEGGKRKGEETENAVLFCTSVAARGLDVPFVSHVVQFDLPTEGGVTEYIHRAGRTARAGASGQATSFLLPSEKEWVPWVEAGMRDGAEKRGVKDVKLRELGIEDVLKDGFGGEGREFETRATDVQMGFERWVSEEEENSTLARNAFTSHIRAYATHPSSEKSMFNTKALHLGHLAKSFGMREAPSSHSTSKSKKPKAAGRVASRPAGIGRPITAREQAERAIAGLPKRGDVGEKGGFETGRRRDEDRAVKRLQDRLMKGPTGDGAGEFQVASPMMLESLAKGQALAGKRKR